MARTITVKGIGKASAKPDRVVLTMTLENLDKDYEAAMEMAGYHVKNLNNALLEIGFETGSIKTTNFNVRTDYDQVQDRQGNYQSVFRGYEVVHHLKVEFDFEMQRLSQTLSAIAACLSNPQLTIAFTVKDATAINEEMLRSATINAKRKAEILCDASGAKLGNLIAIDYNWGELDIYSHTRFDCCEEALAPMKACSIDIDPEDIDVSDTATFVWELV